MFTHRSPKMPFAVGGGLSIHMTSKTVCPAPIFSGTTSRYAQVGILMPGNCAANACGTAIAAVIEKIKISVVAIAIVF
jgi:hypothetical protein